ncbi:MAG: ABC transporter permease [Armatimonadota bacterium]|nr:ABC transporter permease [Armatimonadota bacterium]MDR7569732.1 ABC transporter permease [Armatimonadota bacterium]MDR7614114.1 ABC transporter permease [Armatimonadota bacterium]
MRSELPVRETSAARPLPAGWARSVVEPVVARGGPLVILLLLVAYLSLSAPYFFTVGNFKNILQQTAAVMILAVGQTVVIIGAGIDLSVAATLALSASLGAVAMTYWGQSVWVGVLLALAAGSLVGLVNGVVITKGRVPDFIVTLGTMSAARGVALILTGGLPVPSHLTAIQLRAYLPQEIIWLGSGSLLGIPVAPLVALVMAFVGWVVLQHTPLGRGTYAVGGNREAARVSGIDVDRVKISGYVLSGFLAAVAGLVLTGRLNSANALMAEGMELQSIAAVVLGGTNLFGGVGGVGGTVVGALIMGVLGNGLNLLNVSAFWQRVIMGLMIVLVVILDQWRRRQFEAWGERRAR